MENRSFYNEILTEHNIHPEFKHDLPDANIELEGVNPSCGDDITLKLKVDGDVITDGAFVGDGCAISQASADIMLGMIVGRKKEEALRLGEIFRKMIQGEATAEEIDELEEAGALKDISHMPARVKCAVLGWRTLKEAVDEALAVWIDDPEMFYVLGSAVGPHPYPYMVRHFQSVIGREARAQMLEELGRLPDACLACVGGGSNAIGMFHPFLEDADVRLVGVEAAGTGETGCFNSAPLNLGTPGVLHGNYSMLLQNNDGQIEPSHSISAGLDYPSVGPEHAQLKDMGRAEYVSVTDREALDAFFALSRHEGVIPALESSHALAQAIKMAPSMSADTVLLVSLSGRGDKDVAQVAELMRKENA